MIKWWLLYIHYDPYDGIKSLVSCITDIHPIKYIALSNNNYKNTIYPIRDTLLNYKELSEEEQEVIND